MNTIGFEVIGFDERFARKFADLNYEWIEKAYTVEEHDREILDHPVEQIIEPGGQIFFAMVDGEPAGTVALIEMGENAFELAKMAVSPEHRGLGLSNLLMDACIEYSRAKGKNSIILESNTKQVAAIGLYRKYGFVETPLDPNSQFVRANIRMELAISDSKL
ncbi:MAG: GNAT family N-acetyltransferase [Pyrinomonadaceae bacterium]|nr:GNAT family N-acetyltransferase [Acidobacteriota bacterium]MBP7377401.1 GNAT family N-acetyltransferase [Pyrinomonadaceae bacterium]